ncbi:MAG TPA: phosphoribosylformylglycinamidine cyclo-ligase [Blastocatellia bacterium]|nr:phosphoribosylformylglycinamidine cyclo-ligase [Blastocatellia bacterium]
MSQRISYSDAGVDIDAANDAKARIRKLARETFTKNVMTDIGSFGGMFRADFGPMSEPILVASADGVGTKLRVAFMTGIHNTIGEDLVNHCINDILVQGARPLFFLDYIAAGKIEPIVIAQVVEGLARACKASGCALLGGETAEMPGFYAEGEYDVAGVIVGIVDKSKVIDGSKIKIGDIVLGLPSIGLHTNGYSLARKLLFEIASYKVDSLIPELNCTAGAALLKGHISYLESLEGLINAGHIAGLAHITGGGLLENIPRILPEGTGVEIKEGSWPVLPLFTLMQKIGNVEMAEMYRTFNMGIGMVVVVSADHLELVKSHFTKFNQTFYEIGRVIEGIGQVSII